MKKSKILIWSILIISLACKTSPKLKNTGSAYRHPSDDSTLYQTKAPFIMPYNRILDPVGQSIQFGDGALENHSLDAVKLPDDKTLVVEDRFGIAFFDIDSKKQKGKYLYVREMANYDNLVSASNKNWKSDISEMRFDCANTSTLLMATKLYAEKNGKGELVGNYKGGNVDDIKIVASDTVAAKIFDYVCHTKVY
jgi:hypothetical protein